MCVEGACITETAGGGGIDTLVGGIKPSATPILKENGMFLGLGGASAKAISQFFFFIFRVMDVVKRYTLGGGVGNRVGRCRGR